MDKFHKKDNTCIIINNDNNNNNNNNNNYYYYSLPALVWTIRPAYFVLQVKP